ncbi:MAG: hypothetical protein LBD77_08285 [Bifidobacteriaceae bacterium]|jgi:hypothetical protein|nr:hypothetical protein [Bifidobacteriaceae bacterium]
MIKKLHLTTGLVLAAGLALTGCDSGSDVATLDGKGGGGAAAMTAEEEQAANAKKLSACLEDAGIPIDTWDQEDGQVWVDIASEEAYAANWGPEWGSNWYAGNSAETEAAMEAALAALAPLVEPYDKSAAEGLAGTGDALSTPAVAGSSDEYVETPRYLIIGQVDHTEDFVKCLDESGYTQPVWKQDPAEELKYKQATAKVTAEWAACARDNGYPNVKDPDPPVADEWSTQPTAVLPADITTDQLRALLAVCPNFDAEKQKAYDEAVAAMDENASEEDWEKLYEEFDINEPAIGFDLPGLDGQGWEGIEELDEATLARYDELSQILYEQANAYWESQEGAVGAITVG